MHHLTNGVGVSGCKPSGGYLGKEGEELGVAGLQGLVHNGPGLGVPAPVHATSVTSSLAHHVYATLSSDPCIIRSWLCQADYCSKVFFHGIHPPMGRYPRGVGTVGSMEGTLHPDLAPLEPPR